MESTIGNIKIGVPQNSVLGPIILLVYIKDLPKSTKVFDVMMCADHITLYCNLNPFSYEKCNITWSSDLDSAQNWDCSNVTQCNSVLKRQSLWDSSQTIEKQYIGIYLWIEKT